MLSKLQLPTVTVEVPKRIVEQFRLAAKKAFPKETLAYLLGTDAGTSIEVEELWFPEDLEYFAKEREVLVPEHWAKHLREHARENDLQVLGDIHSHPDKYREMHRYVGYECVPSEADYSTLFRGVCGICLVTQCQSGKLTTKIKFWGPQVPVKTRII